MSLDLDDVITLDEAGEIAGRAPVSLRRAAEIGTLVARKIGRPGPRDSSGRQLWITTRGHVSEYMAYVAAEQWQALPQRARRPGGHTRRQPRSRAAPRP